MKPISWLYYTQKESAHKLTNRETGQIDMPAYINGQAKFFIDNESAKRIPKKIIVDNINFKEVDPIVALKFFFVLNKLVQEGFELYDTQGGYLRYLNFEEWFDELFQFKSKRPNPFEYKISAQLPPAEQFFRLNEEKINQLSQLFEAEDYNEPFDVPTLGVFLRLIANFSQDSTFIDGIKLRDICTLKEPDSSDDEDEDEEKREDTKDKENQIITEALINSDTSEKKLFSLLKAKRITTMGIESNARHLSLINQILLHQRIPKLYLLNTSLNIFNLKQLKHLKFLYVEHDVKIEENFLQLLPKKLNFLQLNSPLTGPLISSTLKIDHLAYRSTPDSADSIIQLLNCVENLQRFDIQTFLPLNSPNIVLRPLPNLKALSAMTDISLINVIIQQAENLEMIDIRISKQSIFPSLPKLKQATLSQKGDEYPDLHYFLSNAPHLEQLTVRNNNRDLAQFKFSNEPLCLTQLKYIDVSELLPVDIDFLKEFTEYLLRVAPNLKILKVPILPPGIVIPQGLQVIETQPKPSSTSMMDPVHIPENIRPPQDNLSEEDKKAFENTYHQAMVIEKLKVFISQTKSIPIETLSMLDKGICASLAEYFYTYGLEGTKEFLDLVKNWDASSPPPQDLNTKFQNLYDRVDSYYISHRPSSFKGLFIGDNQKSVLTKEDKLMLSSPWHRIAIQKFGSSWYIYDPNHLIGPIFCENEQKLLLEIQRSLGKLVSVMTDKPDLYRDCQSQITDISKFIKNGGFLCLNQLNPQQLLKVLEGLNNLKISEEDLLVGLSLYSTSPTIVWQILPIPLCQIILNRYPPQSVSNLALKSILAEVQQRVDSKEDELDAKTNSVALAMPDETQLTERVDSKEDELDAKTNSVALAKPDETQLTEPVDASDKRVADTEPLFRLESLVSSLRDLTIIDGFYSSLAKQFSTWENPDNQAPEDIRRYVQKLLHEDKVLLRTKDMKSLSGLRNGIQIIAKSVSHPLFYVDKAEDLQVLLKRFRLGDTDEVLIEEGSPLADFLNSPEVPKTILINYDNFSTEEIIQFNEVLDKEPKINGIALSDGVRIIGLQNMEREDAYQESDFYSRFLEIKDFDSIDVQSFQEVLSIEPFTAQEGHSIALFDSPAWKEMLFGQVRLNGSSFTFIPGRLQPPSLPPSLILENAPFNDPEFIEFWRQAFITGKISIHGKEYIVPKDFKLIQKSGYAFSQAVFSNIVQEPEHVLNSQNLRLFLGGQVIQNGQIIYQPGLIEQSSNKTLSILVSDELSHGQWSQILEACRRYDTTIKVQALPNIFIPEQLQNHISRYDKRSEMQIIETNDVEQYLHQNPSEGLIIDVSDFDASDLFEFLKVKKDASGQFIFESTPSWLLAQLAQGKVTLKGHFSPGLTQAIAEHFLLDKSGLASNLTLVTDMDFPLKQLVTTKHPLYTSPRVLEPRQEESLSLLTTPPADFVMEDLSVSQLNQKRIESIGESLRHQPFVMVTGLSGCGKTTWIKKHFQPFLEKEGIEAWLESKEDPSYLFFDEANLSHQNWLMFEGLLQNPSFIIYEGRYHLLPASHKVIFAGNPITYGDERTLPKLFIHHPNVVLFEPIPPQALKEEILLPLLSNTDLAPQAEGICEEIIKLYNKILTYSKESVLISPRELQSIALLTIANANQQDPINLARYYAYIIGRQVVPAKYLADFEAEFKTDMPRIDVDDSSEFLITSSRQGPAAYLRDLLNLRAYRQSQALSPEQLTAGLGGLILEGEPGIGKSELLIKILEEHSIRPLVIPPSISIKERKELLLKAFDEGAVVIIDEMNSGPMMESFLNALLMGTTPEGQRATRPGFTVLATQNPISRGGRREQSEALLRRMIKFNLENYSQLEIINILIKKGFEKTYAQVIANIYLDRLEVAKQQGRKPEPNFRDLIRFASKILEHPESQEYFLQSLDVNAFRHHLKKFIELKFSPDEIIEFINKARLSKLSQEFPLYELINFINELPPGYEKIHTKFLEKIDSVYQLSPEDQGIIISQVNSIEIKKLLIQKLRQFTPMILEELLKIPDNDALLPQDITIHLKAWMASGIEFGPLTLTKLILPNSELEAKLTSISDANFKYCCEHLSITDKQKLFRYCNTSKHLEILAKSIKNKQEFDFYLQQIMADEQKIKIFLEHTPLELPFDYLLDNYKKIPIQHLRAFLDKLSKKASLTAENINQLFNTNIEVRNILMLWCIDRKFKLDPGRFRTIFDFTECKEKIQKMSQSDFNAWKEINSYNQVQCEVIRTLNKEKKSLDVNTFIRYLGILFTHLPPSNTPFWTDSIDLIASEITDWIDTVDLIGEKLLDIKEYERIISTNKDLNDAILKKLLSNTAIQKQLENIGDNITERTFKKMLVCPLFAQNIKSINSVLLNQLIKSQISENIEAFLLGAKPFNVEIFSNILEKHSFSQAKVLLEAIQTPLDDDERQKDIKSFLIKMHNLALKYSSCNFEQKASILEQVSLETQEFVQKYKSMDMKFYHYLANVFIALTVLPLIYLGLRKIFFDKNIFYTEENELTQAAQSIKKNIQSPKN